FSGNRFTFVCPKTLKPDADVLRDLKQRGADVAFSDSLKNYRTYDVFYANRLQEERFGSRKEFERLRKQFVITKALAKSGKAAILNPLPRIDEIDPAVDDLPQAAYFRQAQNGLYVRMALMDMLLK
ncbi:MAG: aspartate carbamoyltransferase, partial [Patescibacteria group bacterium]|nr:aspartate carbamoyltransferase [Patescibacteria group bacterium]